MRVVKTLRLVKVGVWIVYSWVDDGGNNVIAGRVKRMRKIDRTGNLRDVLRDGYYYISFHKKGFMANSVLRDVVSGENLLDEWAMRYRVSDMTSAEFTLVVCDDEQDLRNAFLSAVM